MVQFKTQSPLPREQHIKTQNGIRRKAICGFSLIGMLSLIMMFTTILLGLSTFAVILVEKNKKQHICDNFLFYQQDQLSKKMNTLLDLNREALSLRFTHKLAKVALVAAIASGNPANIAAAKNRISLIESKQYVLRTKQQTLLLSARQDSLSTQIRYHYLMPGGDFISHEIGLAVVADVPSDIAPAYYPKADFINIQKITGNFFVNKYKNSCTVTIEERNGIFRATFVKSLRQLEKEKW